MSYVQYVCDVETTGTDPEKHDIIEICLWRIGDEESKTWRLTPLAPENIQQEALNINKHLREDILHQTEEGKAKYKHPSEVLPEIEMWLMEDGAAAEERVFIGQNPMFDKDGTERNQGYIIDTMQLARLIDVCTGKKRARYGLGALVKDFGVTKATAHRADGDVKMTKELFEKIYAVLKDPLVDAFNESYK
jgi:DNA polymerase III alpha subunit (gram-positive type)